MSALRKPDDYNMSDFVYEKTVQNTSKTLLKFVAELVSDSVITKKSLTLAQCIQQHVAGNTRNQTSLGLAVQLHHRFGSSELIRILCEHGLISSYDEVLEFRKSVSKYVSENEEIYNRKVGLFRDIDPIFSWADNYNLSIASPNGTKTTHAMVMEYTQHPTEPIQTSITDIMQLSIPRLKKSELAAAAQPKKAIQIEHYTGAQKLKPPHLPPKNLSTSELQITMSINFYNSESRTRCSMAVTSVLS